MDKIPFTEIISSVASIIATGAMFSKMFFTRIKEVEQSLSIPIHRLSDSLNEIDKRLAVNSTIIEQFMKGGCIHGRKSRD